MRVVFPTRLETREGVDVVEARRRANNGKDEDRALEAILNLERRLAQLTA